MPDRLLVDTDVLVEYLRGKDAAAKWLESQEIDLVVSAITVAELFAGTHDEREARILDQFLLAVKVLPANEEIGRLAGQYRRTYGPSHGTGLADALIAATAVVHRASLVTFNERHFRHFPMLTELIVPY